MELTAEPMDEEAVIDAILSEADETPIGLAFVYSNGLQTNKLRFKESERHFMALINEEMIAVIEMPDET